MLGDGTIKVAYNTGGGNPTLRPTDLMDNVLISRDASIVRFFDKASSGNIFSPVVFLSQEAYDTWNDRYQEEAIKKSSSLSVIRSRFLNGLDMLDDYFANQTLSIEDKSEIAKIRNHVVNTNPALLTTAQDVEVDYLSNATKRLIAIVGESISKSQFEKISGGFFYPEIKSDKSKGFHLRLFPELESIDSEISELDDYFTKPESKITESRDFGNSDDYKRFQDDIEAFESKLTELVSKKVDIIKSLKSSGDFEQEMSQIAGYKHKKPATKEVVDIVNERYRSCSACGSKTDSDFCSNVECKTITMPVSNYQISEDTVFDYFLRGAVKINIESNSLIPTSDRDKKTSIIRAGRRFVKEVKGFLDENPTTIKINHLNLNKKQDPNKDLDDDLCNDNSKTVMFDNSNDELSGRVVHFWEYYKDKGIFYGIIQTSREIKTPGLVTEVRNYRKSIGSSRPIDLTPDYYDNPVYYVAADSFGQIKEVGYGVLYTEEESNIRLKLGSGEYDRIISLQKPKYRPIIDDIMFYCDDDNKPTSNGEELDVERIFNDLNHSDETALENNSDVYRYSRRYFYPPELGYFVFEVNNRISKVIKEESVDMGSGSINKFEFITLNDAIRYREYSSSDFKSWSVNLAMTYLKNMFSPNRGSDHFLKKYIKGSNSRFKDTTENARREASLFSTIIQDCKSPPVYLQYDEIVSGSGSKKPTYPRRFLSASNIREVTPFFLQELKSNDLIEKIEFSINNNQSEVRNGKLNILEETMSLYPPKISNYLPKNINESTNPLTAKHLIQNSLRESSLVDDFTVSLNITLNKDITLYEMTLLQGYMSENGLNAIHRTQKNMPIPIRTNDLISILL